MKNIQGNSSELQELENKTLEWKEGAENTSDIEQADWFEPIYKK